MVAKKMRTLQDALGKDVKLVSFSMDPDHDTPAVLKEYAQKVGADSHRWLLLSGDRNIIVQVAASLRPDGVKPDLKNLSHSDWLVFVGPDGVVRTSYDAADARAVSRLASDAVNEARTRRM